MRALVAVALAIALSGCIQGIFVDTEQTTRRFMCSVLSTESSPQFAVEVRVDPRVDRSPLEVLGRLQTTLASLRGVEPAAIEVTIVTVEGAPEAWDDAAWTKQLDGHSFHRDLRTTQLVLYWIPGTGAAGTGSLPAPGVVAVHEQAMETKALATGHSLEDVTFAVLLHHVGHALGGVNQGAPMQANHEGAPGHDADAASVLNAAWHDANDPSWAPNATYDGFGAAMRADWEGAVMDPQVCP